MSRVVPPFLVVGGCLEAALVGGVPEAHGVVRDRGRIGAAPGPGEDVDRGNVGVLRPHVLPFHVHPRKPPNASGELFLLFYLQILF